MEKVHRRSKGRMLGAVHEGVTFDQRMQQRRGLVEIRGIEFDRTKGRERTGHSRMQQGSISQALQATTASGNDPLMDLTHPNEQTTDDIGGVSHWLRHGL